MYLTTDIIGTMNTIEDQLRDVVRSSGLSIKAVSDRTGIPYAAVHGFVTDDERTIMLRTAGKLATLFGLELRPMKQATRKGR